MSEAVSTVYLHRDSTHTLQILIYIARYEAQSIIALLFHKIITLWQNYYRIRGRKPTVLSSTREGLT